MLSFYFECRPNSNRQKVSISSTYKGTKRFSYPKQLFDKLRSMIHSNEDKMSDEIGKQIISTTL
jgi:hypothetical protein